ncbi:hypothetical protein KFE94_11255 [bacterium SCSIO 12643]|nr:hypothetical protein KFE94_11255 [bacterium SCSIO 12643]
MGIILNLIVIVVFINWFQNNLKKSDPFPLIGMVLLYLVSTVASFALGMMIQNGYLDGIYLVIFAGISIILYWLWVTIALIRFHRKQNNNTEILIDLIQVLPLIIIPILLWIWLSTASLKIGG